MTLRHTQSPRDVLKEFQLAGNVYLLGSFEKGLTIYNQQVRALNLAWSLIESMGTNPPNDVAVIGGGFAGLTAAAALLKKGVRHVAIFEKHAMLCPLQQGSDARWVHPRIYEWPDVGSGLPTAALPLLNWNAGRASDVVVQVLNEWEKLAASLNSTQVVDLYLGVRHLRISKKLEIEWVGQRKVEHLEPELRAELVTEGGKRRFDSIILAVGFGLEIDGSKPYWRNETFGQPHLVPGKWTYLISGHGDGALIDLFRIRIARFRQDRILVELFSKRDALVNRLRELKQDSDRGKLTPEKLYDRLEEIAQDEAVDFTGLLSDLTSRLRSDTDAVLRLHEIQSFRQVFTNRTSFQNRFLLFSLYKAGGFYPSSKSEVDICQECQIPEDRIIRRHGIKPEIVIEEVLESDFFNDVRERVDELKEKNSQPSEIRWVGGYWALPPGASTNVSDETKSNWRQEYLPPATEVFATGFMTGVAGYLTAIGSCGEDFRATLHRTLRIGPEITLQQVTSYVGRTLRKGAKARTFAFNHGTIGYAAVLQRVVRSRKKRSSETDESYRSQLQSDMAKLELNRDSQQMSDEVRSLVAIPILSKKGGDTVAVLFADATVSNAFGDEDLAVLKRMCQTFASHIEAIRLERVRNFPEFPGARTSRFRERRDLKALEVVKNLTPPLAHGTEYLNLEFTDFVALSEDCQHE